MKKQNFLIIGGTGKIGSEIVRTLRSQGYTASIASSKKSKDTIYINLLTGEGLKDAFYEIDRAFFLSPPGYADMYKILSPLIQEAKRRDLKKIVLMTAKGANANATSPFRRAEIELEDSGLAYNIIRPNWFFQNFNTYWLKDIKTHGKIMLPAGNAKVSFIDVRDIAAVASKLLTNDSFNNKDFDLTGPESIDHYEVAKAISEVSGKNITYEDIKPEDFRTSLLNAGFLPDYANFLTMIMGALREGYSSTTTNSVSKILGHDPIGFTQYVNDYKSAWL